MGLINFLMAIAIGSAAGYIANKVLKNNLGFLFCFILGIAGAIIGNIIFAVIGIRMNGYIGGFIMSTVGAIVLLWLVNYFKKKNL